MAFREGCEWVWWYLHGLGAECDPVGPVVEQQRTTPRVLQTQQRQRLCTYTEREEAKTQTLRHRYRHIDRERRHMER
jgi:hypothetical protein